MSQIIESLERPDLRLSDDYAIISPLEGESVIPVEGMFSIPKVAEALGEYTGRLWLKPEFIEAHSPYSNFVVGNGFDEHWEWGETRRNSANHVLFGDITLGFGGSPVTVPVACKPYGVDHDYALHEYVASEYVNRLGFMRTFDPIGIWVNDEKAAFLITRFEGDVKSFDNLDWAGTGDPSKLKLDIGYGLERAAYTLGRYGAQGLTNRDLQAKNVAYNEKTGALRAIDLEQLRLVQTKETPNLEAMYDAMLHEMLLFIASIHDAGFRWEQNQQDASGILRRALLDPYKSTLRHPSSMVEADYGKPAIEMVEELCNFVEGVSEDQIEEYWQMAKNPKSSGITGV